jgi:O-antigen/teichoic acid export membrane protein
VIGTAFFPLLTAQLRENRDEARTSLFLLARIFLFIAAPLALFFTGAADDVVKAVFGDRYASSGVVLSILAWTLVLGFQTSLLWYALLAAYRERAMIAVTAVGLALNVGLNAVLIPLYGPKGAAVTLLVSSFAVLVGQVWMLQRYLFEIPFARLLVKPAVALLASVPVAILLFRVDRLAAGVATAVVYATVLLSLQYISLEEWQPLLQPARQLAGRAWRFAARD